MKLKVCGTRVIENIRDVAGLRPDYMGFIFYNQSPRFVGNNFQIPVDFPKDIQRVGVFVNSSFAEILEHAELFKLKHIQLHGNESVELCANLKDAGFKVIKAFRVDGVFDFKCTEPYEFVADFFLFDTKGELYGGNGTRFDWSVLRRYHQRVPFFLSGGINPENVSEVKKLLGMNIHAIDINSGIEVQPGIKDITKIQKIMNLLRPTTNNLITKGMNYQVNEQGFYGNFGGAYIPEMLYPNIDELRTNYLLVINDDSFQKQFHQLLKDYVGRPTPLYFAHRLSDQFNTRIYLKREDLCHTGAHKINNTIGQILLAKKLGKQKIIAETGAGQHGVATATVCALMGMECIVYMGQLDMERQRPNVERMRILGTTVVPATSGNMTLKDATNEAMRHWINHPTDTHYIIGSVVGPHPYPDMVARFQSVISEEIRNQLREQEGNPYPDYVIACVGGGSNAAGAFYHFLNDEHVQLVGVEAAGKGVETGESAATTALGKPGVLHGSKTLLMQTNDGQVVEPYSISAGLDYPGIGPLHAHLFETGRVQFLNVTDDEAMQAGIELSRTEGIIPAIESAHAIAVLKKIEFAPDDVVVINLSGRGDKDLETYIRWGKY